MGLLIANDNLLTALGITNKEQFDQTFADFSEFETFVEKCGYEYDFDEEGNLILITPKSKEINTGIVVKKDYSKIPFYIEALEDLTLTIQHRGSMTLNYSFDQINWTEHIFTNSNGVENINVNKNQVLYLKGNGRTVNQNHMFFSLNRFNVGGNILSLYYMDDFIGQNSLPENTIGFQGLFSTADGIQNPEKTNLVSAKNLVLPINSINCSRMFRDCYNLFEAPELPATILTPYCYSDMFKGCTSLLSAPELPATTLADYCYDSMFKGCTNLNYIKAMFTTNPKLNSSYKYTQNWVNGVSPTGTFVKNSAATWNETGNHGVPSGWTVELADS